MSTRTGIVWLASYPKCGSTWVRFMLYAALYGPPARSVEVPRKIPDLHRWMPLEAREAHETWPMLAKTHMMLTERHPKLAETVGAIHIIRHPRDVVLSAINYQRLTGEGAKARSEAAYAQAFIRNGGDADWRSLGYGTWAGHARSWRGVGRFPVLGVRYEDLKENAGRELARMLDFLGVEVDAGRREEAVRASSFDAMRAMEIREKQRPDQTVSSRRLFIGHVKATRKGVYFVNKGASGQSLDTLAPGLDADFDRSFAGALAEFGYG